VARRGDRRFTKRKKSKPRGGFEKKKKKIKKKKKKPTRRIIVKKYTSEGSEGKGVVYKREDAGDGGKKGGQTMIIVNMDCLIYLYLVGQSYSVEKLVQKGSPEYIFQNHGFRYQVFLEIPIGGDYNKEES